MIMIGEKDAEGAATKYAQSIGVGPFIVDGSELDETESSPFWRVFLGFTEPFEVDTGPDSMIVRVDAITGEATHIPML